MPELPEVETIRAGLSQLLPGKIIAAVKFDWSKSFPNAKADVDKFLIGAEVVKVERRAKVLLIELSSKYSLAVHLKMTGQLVYDKQTSKIKHQTPSKGTNRQKRTAYSVKREGTRFAGGHPTESLVGKLPDKSTRVIFTFSDGSKLFFNDQRKFGWVKLFPTAEVPNIDFMKKVGPEPLSKDFTWQVLRARLSRRPNTSIKAALLDQSTIAGIGNIYADESLWGAKIHPATFVKNLSDTQIKKLHKEIIYVLKLAIKKGGSTDKNYVNAEGKKGSYLDFAHVFRCEDQPCPRCGHEIVKIRVAGRGTHICPKCQRLTKR
jgi:formamidopyrimidine-DNA glycosylase